MIHLVTFADESMSQSRALCASSAKAHGVDRTVCHDSEGVALWDLAKKHRKLFKEPKGCGYWAWKPLILWSLMKPRMEQVTNGDILIYADAGIEFIDNVNYIIDRMDQDVFLFGNMWEHAHWCKRDIISAVWPHGPWKLLSPWQPQFFGKQVQASVIFFRVNDWTKAFVKEWLDWCLFEGGRLIDDLPSMLPNHPEFQENRHDQAILTTMAYRDGLRLHWWPSVYNAFTGPIFTYEKGEYVDTYPPLFHHHRRRNEEWKAVA